jgi:hypothetical protein
VIYTLLPPGACAALNGAITDPAANSEKGALSFCALCQGAPPAVIMKKRVRVYLRVSTMGRRPGRPRPNMS